MMQRKLISLLGILLLACGGKGVVDLGANHSSTGWADTKGSVAAGAAPAKTTSKDDPKEPVEPQTLYSGRDSVLSIAVEGDTFVAVIEHSDQAVTETRIDVCDLGDCAGTLRTIYKMDTVDMPGPSGDPIVSRGEVFWTLRSNDMTHGDRILACATAGCPDGPRLVAVGDGADPLAADNEYVYWFERRDGNNAGIARCLRTQCSAPEFKEMPAELLAVTLYSTGPMQLQIDEAEGMAYFQYGGAIFRISSDLSGDYELFHQDAMILGGLAIVNGYVYFAVSSLLGQIRRCPTSGCDPAGSELVVDAPRWPSRIVADANGIYWLHKAESAVMWPYSGSNHGATDLAAISTSPTAAATNSRLIVPSFHVALFLPQSNGCGPVMNAHHVYWCEFDGNGSLDFVDDIIRMVAR